MYLQSSIFCVHCSVLLWIFCFVSWNRWSQLSIILHSLVRSSKSTVCTLVEHMFSEVSCFDLNEGVGFQPVPELFASSVVFVDIGYLFLLWLYCLLLLNVFTSWHNLVYCCCRNIRRKCQRIYWMMMMMKSMSLSWLILADHYLKLRTSKMLLSVTAMKTATVEEYLVSFAFSFAYCRMFHCWFPHAQKGNDKYWHSYTFCGIYVVLETVED